MGNCCGGDADESSSSNYTSGKAKPAAFQGQGHRLGSADEARVQQQQTHGAVMDRDELPEPIYNPNLTDEDREQQRKARLAAAEARAKAKQPQKPKKPSEPLRGPNSQPAMTWTVGS
ncbi:hypothetical protein MHU86_480 [Fragilaria crotonensis]|nr:hypothetical protein MHU86_480 [Fragilaria crotonensis]